MKDERVTVYVSDLQLHNLNAGHEAWGFLQESDIPKSMNPDHFWKRKIPAHWVTDKADCVHPMARVIKQD